jgi:uncharacterized UBP type Zn finger protein
MVGTVQAAALCAHLEEIRVTTSPKKHFCEDCVKTGDTWVHLRMCLTCGHVGCFDSSKNRHARAHYDDIGHPLIRSAEPGERWIWCYIDELSPGELSR